MTRTTTAPPPPTIATPPSAVGSPHTPAVAAYAALTRVDPQLIPNEAARIARKTHRFAALRPQPSTARDQAIAQWRRDLDHATDTDTGDVPPLDAMVAALMEEHAAKELHGLFTNVWEATVAGLAKAIADHGDSIVVRLRGIHDQAWQDFITHAGAVVGHRSIEAVLAAGNDTADDYRHAGHALTTFSATRAARTKLQALRGYHADVGGHDDLTVFRHPETVRRTRLPKDTLDRWRAIVDTWPTADPWIPTRDEAEAWYRSWADDQPRQMRGIVR